MDSFIEGIFVLTMVMIILITLIDEVTKIISGTDTASSYYYVDLNGNAGIAEECKGESFLSCTSNGRTFGVKEFHKND